MARIKSIIEGLTILEKYNMSDYSVCAEHDTIWAGPDSLEAETKDPHTGDGLILISFNTVSEEDYEKLKELGWHIDSDIARFCVYV